MKFTVAQLNYHIGNFAGNRDLICSAIRKAKAEESDLIIFSELCIPGYPPLDLLDRQDFIEKCDLTVQEIAKECTGIAAIVGSPTINKKPEGKNSLIQLSCYRKGKLFFLQIKLCCQHTIFLMNTGILNLRENSPFFCSKEYD